MDARRKKRRRLLLVTWRRKTRLRGVLEGNFRVADSPVQQINNALMRIMPDRRMAELARVETQLRQATDPEAAEVVKAIVAWRLARQLEDDPPKPL